MAEQKRDEGKPPVVDGLFEDPAYTYARKPKTRCFLCGAIVSSQFVHRVRHGNKHVAQGEALAFKDVLDRTLFFPIPTIGGAKPM